MFIIIREVCLFFNNYKRIIVSFLFILFTNYMFYIFINTVCTCNVTFILRILFIAVYLVYFIATNDLLLCEDHPSNSNEENITNSNPDEFNNDYDSWNNEDRISRYISWCAFGSLEEKHAKTIYDKILKIEWHEKLMSMDINTLTSEKDRLEWIRLKEMYSKLGLKDSDFIKYLQDKRSSLLFKENNFLMNASHNYSQADKMFLKYPYLGKVDISKYKLPKDAFHPKLNDIRHPK